MSNKRFAFLAIAAAALMAVPAVASAATFMSLKSPNASNTEITVVAQTDTPLGHFQLNRVVTSSAFAVPAVPSTLLQMQTFSSDFADTAATAGVISFSPVADTAADSS